MHLTNWSRLRDPVPFAGVASVLIAAAYKGWRGEPIIVERAGMRFRLPRKREIV